MHYDVAVIGAGWAGFNAAVRARQLGLKVCLCEKKTIGGTCLNRGCIPTKALIQSAKIYASANYAGSFGIKLSRPEIDFPQIQLRKNNVVSQLKKSLETLLKGIDIFSAEAKILSRDRLSLGNKEVSCNNIIIAAGSRPYQIDSLPFDNKKILSSDQILDINKPPESLLIIGGGVIGCEFASFFSLFGSRVAIVEKMPRLLPFEDSEITKKLEAIFRKRRIRVYTNNDAASVNQGEFEQVLVCIGRVSDTQGLGLEQIGVDTAKGSICTDDYLRTNIPGIYAAGDCTGKILLAHAAERQGIIAAENIADTQENRLKKFDGRAIPNCIFTSPEIASVGITEDIARQTGMQIRVSKFDFLGSAMARIIGETDGFIKIISCAETASLLGASIIGPHATELIGSLTLALSCRMKLSDLTDTVFGHPTLSEGIISAAKLSA